ncbi:MAG TPA: hypothetical protein VD902_13675 [Symbiobacteriaceae bacterium]|nr:hypothetical protein [Symbiobacteriaceae bacterium]
MTYLVYAAWFLSLLWVLGELDRLISSRFLNRYMPEMLSGSLNVWFVPPLISLVLPGAGQFLNRQPLKALLCFSWPVWAHYLYPWQLSHLSLWQMVMPWYIIVVVDAVCVALILRLRDMASEREFQRQARATAVDLSEFLDRRKANQFNGNSR